MNTTPAHTSHAAAPEISPAAPRSPSRRSGKASAPITPSSASARSSDDDDDDEEEEDDDDENESNEDDASPYLSLLVPGALVNVAPRTWPGINKIGGTGKVISAFDGLLLCAPQLTALACRCVRLPVAGSADAFSGYRQPSSRRLTRPVNRRTRAGAILTTRTTLPWCWAARSATSKPNM